MEGFKQDHFKSLMKVQQHTSLDAMGNFLRELCKFESSKSTSSSWRTRNNNNKTESVELSKTAYKNTEDSVKIKKPLAYVRCFNCLEYGHYKYSCTNMKVGQDTNPTDSEECEDTSPKKLECDPESLE